MRKNSHDFSHENQEAEKEETQNQFEESDSTISTA
jgi:hypothetical protein